MTRSRTFKEEHLRKRNLDQTLSKSLLRLSKDIQLILIMEGHTEVICEKQFRLEITEIGFSAFFVT